MSEGGEQMIVRMCKGNPGALNVLMQTLNVGVTEGAVATLKLDALKIWGSDIWVAYKYICGEDLDKFVETVLTGDSKELLKKIDQIQNPVSNG